MLSMCAPTTEQVERLMQAARACRYGHRDATMILLAYRHAPAAEDQREDCCPIPKARSRNAFASA